jgi:hypothetical protein
MTESNYLEGFDLDALDSDIGVTDDSDRRKVGGNSKDDWFKGEKGRNYRMAFVYFHPLELAIAMTVRKKDPKASLDVINAQIKAQLDKRVEKYGKPVDKFTLSERTYLESPQFKTFTAYYKDGVGYVAEPKGLTAEERRFWEAQLGESRKYVTTLALTYPVDRDGEPLAGSVTSNWNIVKWRFSPKQYETVFKVGQSLKANDLTLAGQDLLVTCTNDKFQQFTMVGAGKALYRKSPLSETEVTYNGKKMPFLEAVLYAATQVGGPNGKNLIPFRELTTSQLKEKLGLSPGAASQDVSAEDTDSLLDGLGSVG